MKCISTKGRFSQDYLKFVAWILKIEPVTLSDKSQYLYLFECYRLHCRCDQTGNQNINCIGEQKSVTYLIDFRTFLGSSKYVKLPDSVFMAILGPALDEIQSLKGIPRALVVNSH